MSTKWQNEFELALKYKSAVILYGNVRDKYLHQPQNTDNVFELLSLKNYLLQTLEPDFLQVKFYDPLSKIKEYPESKKLHRKIASEFGETEPTPVVVVKGHTPVERDLQSILRDLSQNQKICYVFQYADKITPTSIQSSEDERRLILSLEKIIENMHPSNKLVLTYLSLDQIPVELGGQSAELNGATSQTGITGEFFKEHPKVRILNVGMPERKELRQYFKECHGIKSEETLDEAVNFSEGLRLTEIEQIQPKDKPFDIKNFKEVLQYYKFGESKNYWDEIRLDKLNNSFNFFTGKGGIKGQDQAVRKVIQVLKNARADIRRKTGGNTSKPRGVLFFAGPTGVGKTMTAKKLAEFLFGSEESFTRFDMSEYRQEFQVSRLLGAPPGFVGHEANGQLIDALKNKPFSVILFDEIEKAHPRIFDIFLQILDDGRLTGNKGETVFFNEAIIIFTSNIGTRTEASNGTPVNERQDINKLQEQKDTEAIREHFKKCVRDFYFNEISRPELLNRIGENNVVVFDFIDNEQTILDMSRFYLTQLVDNYNNSNLAGPKLTLDMDIDEIIQYFYKSHEQKVKHFGGRALINAIDEDICNNLSDTILQAEYENVKNGMVKVSVSNDQLVFRLLK